MADYSYRVRFTLSETTCLTGEPSVSVSTPRQKPDVTLASRDGKPITDSRILVLRSSGWSTAEDAKAAGERSQALLMLALTKLRIGADIGFRGPSSMFFESGLRWLEEKSGESPILNDVHGVMVFETEPPPRFASVGPVTVRISRPVEQIRELLLALADQDVHLTERELLAFHLFHTSLFESSSDSRLVTLVAAVEALLEHQPRPAAAQRLLAKAINEAEATTELSAEEKRSLAGGLRELKRESISSAGRRLATKRLGKRPFMEMPAPKFFAHCYDLRSRLVHGDEPRPSRQEVGSAAAALEVFVSELLTEPFFRDGGAPGTSASAT